MLYLSKDDLEFIEEINIDKKTLIIIVGVSSVISLLSFFF
jgi:hypothetical protein